MIACYARGDGLGHLTRLRAALHTLGLSGSPVTILTGSGFAADPRVTGGWTVLPWSAEVLASLSPDELIVDAFPAGLRGELTAAALPSGTRVTHLARLLRWDAYLPLLPADPPCFDRTYVLEPLHPAHITYLRTVSQQIEDLELTEPLPPSSTLLTPSPPPAVRAQVSLSSTTRTSPEPPQSPVSPPPDMPSAVHAAPASPPSATPTGLQPPSRSPVRLPPGAWLVVHSGPDAEIHELVAYARETAALEGRSPRLVLVSPRRPPDLPDGIAHLDVYPAWPLFPEAGRIFTAAGFNAVRQLAPWRDRHRVLPFPRTLDDQFARAARLRVP